MDGRRVSRPFLLRREFSLLLGVDGDPIGHHLAGRVLHFRRVGLQLASSMIALWSRRLARMRNSSNTSEELIVSFNLLDLGLVDPGDDDLHLVGAVLTGRSPPGLAAGIDFASMIAWINLSM